MSALWRKEDGGEAARVHARAPAPKARTKTGEAPKTAPGNGPAAREMGVIDKRDNVTRQPRPTSSHGRHRAATANDFH